MSKTKQFDIPKALVWKAYKLVKANKGAAGVDRESIKMFDKRRDENLYKIWNRLSSGSYMPPPVKGVSIPKKQGGERILGIPTVGDRIAQMTIKLAFEPLVEKYFLPDSYGYRPKKSALDAVAITRQRCWKYDWVIEFDIKGLFDNIDHDLLMEAVLMHTNTRWIILYIERWLKAEMQMPDGSIKQRSCGTPQGGVISPILANLFLHYVFDMWMKTRYPGNPWARYADDAIIHCKSEANAKELLEKLKLRLEECKLAHHPDKTKIIYCKDSFRNGNYPNTEFKFLGYDFKRRKVRSKINNKIFMSFSPAICKGAKKDIIAKIRELNVRKRTDLSLVEIAKWLNPLLNGWLNYYGKFGMKEMRKVFERINYTLVKWSRRKYLKLKYHFNKAVKLMKECASKRKDLFAHWKIGITSVLVY